MATEIYTYNIIPLMKKSIIFPIFLFAIYIQGCVSNEKPIVLRLATTTSAYDSGLLDHIIPKFENEHDVRVDIIAVGTGQAITLGELGDVDLLLVHAPEKELAFIEEGHGTERYPVMYNDFVIVGPHHDPANILGVEIANVALDLISLSSNTFISRGDDSGTHIKELEIWSVSDISPTHKMEWYQSVGQGMGSTLIITNELSGYTLTDRGTFLTIKDSLQNLEILVGGERLENNIDMDLRNPYHIIPIDPDKGGIDHDLSLEFIAWIISIETQLLISSFGIDVYGQALFYPNSTEWTSQ